MPLTDLECKNASCPPDKTRVRLVDGGGLYIEVASNGSKRWFWKYYFSGKEKRLALGSYPEVPPKTARLKRDEARLLQQAGADPAQERIVAKLQRKAASVNTFEAVARDLHELKAADWSDDYGARWLARLEKDVFPWIGKLPIAEVKAPLLLSTLRRVEGRGVKELAHSLREACGQVFKHGNRLGACEHNPAATLSGALKPVATKHMAAVLEPKAAGDLMRAIQAYEGQPTTRTALELSALIFQRPGNVRAMEWAWIDLDAAMLTIPAESMKRVKAGKINGRPHFVPLAPRAVELLKDLWPLTGHGRYVFPSLLTGERPMSENTLRTALRRMGFDNETMTPHGFRAMARTLMVERLNVHPDVIEAQLAHGKSGPLGMAYDRAEFMEQRRQMMNLWAEYLQRLAQGAEVVPFRAA
ncbi:MAG: integrase arm-type DNA-binding domain-containing protein [Paucibacter sp.]|nr:integrase arm-type DNA-binding domain-containing protein [Roseateles sp.]